MKKNQRPKVAKRTSGESKPKSLRILFADDELHLQELIAAELPRMGHNVTVCADGKAAVAELEKNAFDCLLVDLDLPGLNGIDVIAKAKAIAPTTEAIVLTGKGSTESAIAALRLGAFDYLVKPCRLVELKSLLQKVATRLELNNRIYALERQLQSEQGEPQMVGNDRSMQRVKALLKKVAPTNSTVLIHGETGTGKELAARMVHNLSLRHDQNFVAVNCGALPENLIESELFGHRRGAFTGADEHRKGMFEVADGGTLFLDEVAELPKATQASLLRVLESGEVKRVGDSEPFKVDVRIVCATHRNLEEMVANGDFRQDLMYRINTFIVDLPFLRDRTDDIPELALHLLKRHRPEVKSIAQAFDGSAIKLLQSHTWPGNIRELANVIEHACILSDSMPITGACLPDTLGNQRPHTIPIRSVGKSLRELEMETIYATLEQLGGNKTATAEQLGISLKTLYNKLNSDLDRKAA